MIMIWFTSSIANVAFPNAAAMSVSNLRLEWQIFHWARLSAVTQEQY
jgi:hypothetical protein